MFDGLTVTNALLLGIILGMVLAIILIKGGAK